MAVSKYWRVWLASSGGALQMVMENRRAVLFFTSGKLLRFGMFLVFLGLLHQQVTQVSGYSFEQMVVFFLTFNLFDMVGQIFFRGIYWFRQQVVSGEFDFKLIKPMNALFQVLTRETDVLDIPLFVLVTVYLLRYVLLHSVVAVWLLIPIMASALLIITAVHIFVASLGVITTEIDHTMMIYRDLSNMARVPTDVYAPIVRGVLTFIVPVTVAYTFPAKVILGLLSPSLVFLSLAAAVGFLCLSLLLWRYALTQYGSASS